MTGWTDQRRAACGHIAPPTRTRPGLVARLGVLAALGLGCARPAPSGGAGETGVGAAPAAATDAAPGLAPSASPPASRDDPEPARAARERLVREIAEEKPWGGGARWDGRVLSAMRAVPRHLFVPGAPLGIAYSDHPQPIGHQQTISQPTIVAIMTDVLDLEGRERVLEVGTGSGYQAAVLSLLAADVYSIEIVAPLGETAKVRLAELGYKNVHVKIGDGYEGWPEHAPFDRVLLTAAPPRIPQALVAQLREGGILVGPVGEHPSDQRLVRWTKRGGSMVEEDLGAVRFVPMVKAAP